jgi:hypothetical protein
VCTRVIYNNAGTVFAVVAKLRSFSSAEDMRACENELDRPAVLAFVTHGDGAYDNRFQDYLIALKLQSWG